MGKRHMSKSSIAERSNDFAIDGMIYMQEQGRKDIKLSKAMTRPAYAYTKAQQRQVIKPPMCEGCGYYYQAEEMPKPDCTFPWFNPEDYDLAAYDYLPCKEGLTYEKD